MICLGQIPFTRTPDSVLFWRLNTLQRTHSCPVHDPPLCSGSQKSNRLGHNSPNPINCGQGCRVTKHKTQQLVEKEPPVVAFSSRGALGTVGASKSMDPFIYSTSYFHDQLQRTPIQPHPTLATQQIQISTLSFLSDGKQNALDILKFDVILEIT